MLMRIVSARFRAWTEGALAGILHEDDDSEAAASLTASRLVRSALLFGAVAVALALILTPAAERRVEALAATGGPGIDRMSTGSIQPSATSYTIRRSVLQSTPNAVCIIRANGVRTGDC